MLQTEKITILKCHESWGRIDERQRIEDWTRINADFRTEDRG